MFNIENTLEKYGEKLLWVLMLSSLMPMLFYDTEFNVPYFMAFKYALIPVTFICYVVAIGYLPNWRAGAGTLSKLFMPILSSGLIVLFMGGHFIAINALIGEQKERYIVGKIIDMGSAGSRGTTYTATVIDDNTGLEKRLEITTREFKTYRIGDVYKKLWYEGSLGFYYIKK